jgi:transcriptional regulator GlxA family with amidase domain
LQLQHSQLPRRLPLAHIAARVGVSLRTLQAAAQSYRGMTLTEMLRRSLMAEAQRLLGDTDLSLREIAARCGYDDPSSFSRDFKRVYGMAPSVHRATLGGAVAAG